MGKIKSKAIRRSASTLIKEGVGFSEDFEKNKQVLNNMNLGKKIRNQMAGLITRMKKAERTNTPK